MEGASQGGGAYLAVQGGQAPNGLVGYPVLQQVSDPPSTQSVSQYWALGQDDASITGALTLVMRAVLSTGHAAPSTQSVSQYCALGQEDASITEELTLMMRAALSSGHAAPSRHLLQAHATPCMMC